jgi:hypothetical protein
MKFSVDEPTLDHWDKSVKKMTANGVKIPIPLEHTTDPEKNRGYLVGTQRGKNSRGLPALFGLVQFRDSEEGRKLAASSDVSIYVPPRFKDGRGNPYDHPITHVALTSYPVIPQLDSFKAIAASLTSGDSNMELSALSLAQKLGIDVNGLDENTAETKVVDYVNQLKAKVAPVAPAAPAAPAPPAFRPQVPGAMAASQTALVKQVREMKLSELVRDGHITKATHDGLVKQYCDDDAIALSLASDDANFNAPFDSLVETLKQNVAFVPGGKTAAQAVALSKVADAKTNPLLANAEMRAAAAKR